MGIFGENKARLNCNDIFQKSHLVQKNRARIGKNPISLLLDLN
jgi:hypothetical protein